MTYEHPERADETYDVVVVGGGSGGIGAAIGAAQAGASINKRQLLRDHGPAARLPLTGEVTMQIVDHGQSEVNGRPCRALVDRWYAQPRWVASAGEWMATLRDGSTLWWADRRSVALRIGLAHNLGLDGVAVGSLGTGDPLPQTG